MNDGTSKRRLRAEDLGRLELRIVACIGRATVYLSISELAREVGTDRPSVRTLLHGLVSMGVLEESGVIGKRPIYRLVGMTMDEVEAAEERPILADHQPVRLTRRHDPEAPTENEERVLEFLKQPATQDQIAERFGYGRSRRSEVVRSLISKGFIRKCGTIRLKELYVRTEASDGEVEAFLLNLQKDDLEAARDRQDRVYDLITEPMNVVQIRERTGFSDAEVHTAVNALVDEGKVISFGSLGGRRYTRLDAPDHLTRAALKWSDTRLRRSELEILGCLDAFGRAATAKEISEATGIRYVGTCSELRRLTSLGFVTREEDPSDRKGIRLLYSLRTNAARTR